jgi:hypothetical protein
MGVRPFSGVTTLAGTAQPIFGSAVTAAVTPPPDPFVNNLTPGSNETQCNLTVTSTAGFLPGDRVAVGLAAAFKPGITAVGSIPDQGTVKKIVSSTVMVVQGLKNAHAATGEWCVLNEDAGNVHLTPVTLSAATYIGNASTVSSTDVSVMDYFASAATLPIDFESIGQSQPMQLSQFWINGSGTYIPRFTQI